MDLFEYQGKDFFARYGVPTSSGVLVRDPQAAVDAAAEVGFPAVIKAQVQVGGRGKAGGVKLVHNDAEALEVATAILGMDIKGHTVHKVWVEHASDIAKEYYVSFTLDRGVKQYLCLLSSEGGVEIEEVAKTHPDAIARVHIDPLEGLTDAEAERVVAEAGIDEPARVGVAKVLMQLYQAFVEGDADLVEVNPLIIKTDGKVHALDAKVTLDDSASYRHPEWEAYRADMELDGREALARSKGLNYIGLDGTVGIIANGAGLAMATLDVVSQVGGRAANFLDLGGGAGADAMANALEVINTDEKVQAVFINIFGGITRCDEVAKGIQEALDRVNLTFPMVIRLDGTNAKEGHEILQGLLSDQIRVEKTMVGAAAVAVELAKKGER
ncbi:ADP-forming succinate--CoA ligase subunit beta [Ferrimicrobium sp.]|uniref:ADP-forming succinate--CoA ligase subunit beta n=1 Tax=Ferrimicrobium sp. TaxID=2926050 RepID=UPI00261F2863|nr:ADP-forming succinate--CoA ligase subunit beta [Ferrimicrobium sp.]